MVISSEFKETAKQAGRRYGPVVAALAAAAFVVGCAAPHNDPTGHNPANFRGVSDSQLPSGQVKAEEPVPGGAFTKVGDANPATCMAEFNINLLFIFKLKNVSFDKECGQALAGKLLASIKNDDGVNNAVYSAAAVYHYIVGDDNIKDYYEASGEEMLSPEGQAKYGLLARYLLALKNASDSDRATERARNLLIAEAIERMVLGLSDKNPSLSGKEAAFIMMQLGRLAEEIDAINNKFKCTTNLTDDGELVGFCSKTTIGQVDMPDGRKVAMVLPAQVARGFGLSPV